MLEINLPEVIFITDEVRVPHPEEGIASLPCGSAVIIRDYNHSDRENYARHLVHIAHECGVMALVAGDVALARNVAADGLHMPEYQLWQKTPNLAGMSLVTAAVKNRRSMIRAAAIGVDMGLCSPIFPTASHPNSNVMGVHRLARLIDRAPLPIIALGGMNEMTMKKLKDINIAGIAAIDGLSKK